MTPHNYHERRLKSDPVVECMESGCKDYKPLEEDLLICCSCRAKRVGHYGHTFRPIRDKDYVWACSDECRDEYFGIKSG